MPLPGRSAGHGRPPRWPLLAAWVVSVASLVAVALLPRSAVHAYGMVLRYESGDGRRPAASL